MRKDLEFLGPAIKVLMKQGVRVRSAVPPQIDKSNLHKIIHYILVFLKLASSVEGGNIKFSKSIVVNMVT